MRVVIIRIYDFTNRTKTCKVVTAKFISDSSQEKTTLQSIGSLVTNEFKPSTTNNTNADSYFLVVAHPRRVTELLTRLEGKNVLLDCKFENKVYVGYAIKTEFITEEGIYNHSSKEVLGLSKDGKMAVLEIIAELKHFI